MNVYVYVYVYVCMYIIYIYIYVCVCVYMYNACGPTPIIYTNIVFFNYKSPRVMFYIDVASAIHIPLCVHYHQ